MLLLIFIIINACHSYSYGMWEKDTYIFNKSKQIHYSFAVVL